MNEVGKLLRAILTSTHSCKTELYIDTNTNLMIKGVETVSILTHHLSPLLYGVLVANGRIYTLSN